MGFLQKAGAGIQDDRKITDWSVNSKFPFFMLGPFFMLELRQKEFHILPLNWPIWEI
jgi:hypothetical protein